MKPNKCAICNDTRDLFAFTFHADETDAGERYTSHLCGTCWEHIAAVARRTMAEEIDALKTKITLIKERLDELENKEARQ